ncbi:uncharacterized protein BDZ99DRAFT_393358 [Mytilinidion resinicola]|uniref:Uncharacterized protein n=1 Tax=Mytilinidion resinicola TaxID=574789 RepID=A0A6A6YDX3_9PEZI|nr:uncharacterized protein BDZ99DRAFT_393358 [Mytilinidion resinicola]KAF2806758.1 hypothetical protein BDZ99DRAFT_393358 [Mytilinidion resinicola]
MEAYNPPFDRSSKPPLSRSNSFKPTAPARVSTAPHTSKKTQHTSLHRHGHHHRHHHTKDVVQSAIQLHAPSSFADLLKQNSRSSTGSPAQSVAGSRSGSVVKVDGSIESKPLQEIIIGPEDVARERARAKVREDEIRAQLQTLSEYSLNSTRRTDDTYYSILEKIAVLRSTIGELQELSNLTKELHEDFQNDADELEEEIIGQMDGFHEFEPQEQQMDVLEERVKVGREKARSLNARLNDARNRVDMREKLEQEWEAKINRMILWGILGTIALLFVLFVLVQQFRLPHKATGEGFSTSKGTWDLHEASIPSSAKEVLSSCHAPASSSLTAPALPVSPSPVDPRLRLFDEL